MSISVYITSYNQRDYLLDSIESVLNQSLKPEQIIVVDDCSTDGSVSLIDSYKSKYPDLISTIVHEQNLGVAKSRIDALNQVHTEYVTYLDGDDIYNHDKLEKEFSLMLVRQEADIVFSNNAYVSPSLDQVLWIWSDLEKPPEGNVFTHTYARDFPRRSLFRMELINYNKFRQIGFQDISLHTFEDFDMRIRLTKQLKVAYYDDVLSRIRHHMSGLSSSQYLSQLKNLEYIFQKNYPLLSEVSEEDVRYVEAMYWDWTSNIAKNAIKEAMANRNIMNLIRALNKYAIYRLRSHDNDKKKIHDK